MANPAEKVDHTEIDDITTSGLAEHRKASKSTTKAPKAPKAPKEAKGERELRHKVYGNEQKITAILTSPPIKPGSNRYRNMQTVIDSPTVGEALKRLKALTPPGVPADIDLAVEKRAIVIE